MLLQEFYQQHPAAYQDLQNDNSQTTSKDLRKTRLTLKQLNQLRKINDVRRYELEQKLEQVSRQYKPAAQPTL